MQAILAAYKLTVHPRQAGRTSQARPYGTAHHKLSQQLLALVTVDAFLCALLIIRRCVLLRAPSLLLTRFLCMLTLMSMPLCRYVQDQTSARLGAALQTWLLVTVGAGLVAVEELDREAIDEVAERGSEFLLR